MIVTTKYNLAVDINRKMYYNTVKEWCVSRGINILLLGYGNDGNDYHYHWELDCSKDEFIMFMLAWSACERKGYK